MSWMYDVDRICIPKLLFELYYVRMILSNGIIMFPFMIKTYAYARYIKQMRHLVSP